MSGAHGHRAAIVAAGWELTGVPYTSARDPGGIARAIGVLRDAGLAERLEAVGVDDAGDLPLDGPTGVRGRSGMLNEQSLVRLIAETRIRVRAARERGRRPLLVGGDCPVLLGALAAIGSDGADRGLVMIDGHEDAWPPRRSETGEASDSEIAIALGRVELLPEPLAKLVPLVRASGVAFIGPRDQEEIADAGVESLRRQVAHFAAAEEIGSARESAGHVMAAALDAIEADAFWLHVDLDVLTSAAFEAVDYPQPGGLDWEAVAHLTVAAVADRRCQGASIVIYNPDLDAKGENAVKLIDYLCRLVRV